jgi:transcriptional regulator with XRE-family HTH domain
MMASTNGHHETVGDRLKRLRLARNLSQRECSSPGVSYAYISRIEAGARTPSVKALRKLSEKLGVSVEYLETGNEDEIEQAFALVGLSRSDFSQDEMALVVRGASAWRRVGAYEATLDVLKERDRKLLTDLAETMSDVRGRVELGVVRP